MGKRDDNLYGTKIRDELYQKLVDWREDQYRQKFETMEAENEGFKERLLSIESSIYTCNVIIQEMENYLKLLEKAKEDRSRSLDQLDDIRKKIGKIWDIILGKKNKKIKHTDEEITAIYYNYVDKIKEIKESYHSWVSGRNYNIEIKTFLKKSPHIKDLINEDFPKEFSLEDTEDITWTEEEKIRHIIHGEIENALAVEFTAIDTGMSKHSIRKKRKQALKRY